MKIPELVYEVRNLARKEEDPVKKDLFFQCAKSLEILGNVAKVGDLIVAEHSNTETPCLETDTGIKWPVDEESIKMMEEHIEALVHYGFMAENDRWPYDNVDMKLFMAKYLKSQSINDSKTE